MHQNPRRFSLPLGLGAADAKATAPVDGKVGSTLRGATSAKASDDPPDHLEELIITHVRRQTSRQRSASTLSAPSVHHGMAAPQRSASTSSAPPANIVARQRSASNMSASPSLSSGPPPKQLPRRPQSFHQQTKNINMQRPAMSVTSYESSPTSTAKLSPLSRSDHALFPLMEEKGSKSMNMKQAPRRPRSRQRSPHPADIARNAADSLKEGNITAMQSMAETTPQNATLPSAEELRQLIDAMQNEFQHLRSAKMQAEARAEKLQTDMSLQRQEMEQHFESLSEENERLKSELSESNIKLGQMTGKATRLEGELSASNVKLGHAIGKANKLEGENRLLKEDTVEMQKALAVLLPKKKGERNKKR